MITGYEDRTIISLPAFAAPLVVILVSLVLLFGFRPQRRLALLTILSVGLGFAFIIRMGFFIRVSYVFAVVTLMAWVMTGYRSRASSDRSVRLGLWFLAYSLFSMVWTFQAPYLEWRAVGGTLHGLPIRTLVQNLQLGLMLAMFVIAFDYCRDRERLRQVIRLFTIVTTVAVLYAVYEALTVSIVSVPYLNLMAPPFTYGGYRRAGATRLGFGVLRPHAYFGEPAWFVGYLLCAIPMLTADLMLTRRKRARVVKTALLVLSILVFFVASSRSGVVAAVCALAVTVAIFRHRMPVFRIGLTLGLTIALGVSLLPYLVMSRNIATPLTDTVRPEVLASPVRGMLMGAYNTAAAGLTLGTDRWNGWMVALQIFIQNPVFGVGFGNYPFWSESEQVGEPVNMFLRILTELGVVGLVFFAMFVGRVLWRVRGLFRLRRSDRELFAYAVLLMAAVVGTLVHRMSFDGLTNDPTVWVFLGIAAALPYLRVQRLSVVPGRRPSPGQTADVPPGHSAQSRTA